MKRNIIFALCLLTSFGVTKCADDGENTSGGAAQTLGNAFMSGANAIATTAQNLGHASYRATTKNTMPATWINDTIDDANSENPTTKTGAFLQRYRANEERQPGDDHHQNNFVTTGNAAAKKNILALVAAAQALRSLKNSVTDTADLQLLASGEDWEHVAPLVEALSTIPELQHYGLAAPDNAIQDGEANTTS